MEISNIKKLTPYQDVNNVLVMLAQGVQEIIGGKMIGLYLIGSLTYDGFNPGSSDIDFLVVMNRVLSRKQLKQLKSMHARIGKSNTKWARRIDGSYITKNMLQDIQPPKTPRPYFNEGKFNPGAIYGNEWIVNLHMLYECGIVLIGPSPKTLIGPVSIDAVREASRKDLHQEWAPKIKDPSYLHNSHYQAYVVLTMCRILYRAKHDDVVSKKVAAAWAKKEYGQPWSDLIQKAENWQHGQEMNSFEETVEFVKFVINKF